MLTALLLITVVASGWGQTVIASWSYDALVAPTATVPTISVINADNGILSANATTYLDGTNGSSVWLSPSTNPELTTFGGSSLNDPRTTPVSGNSLSLANSNANGKKVVFKFATTGYTKIGITFVTRGTSTGFNNHAWEWSTDNVTYTAFGLNTAINTSTFTLKTLDLSSIPNVENQPAVYIRLTVSGATSATGNNRIDNFVVKGTLPDTQAPVATVVPGSGVTDVAINSPITITFDEAIRNIDNSEITEANVASLLTLKETNNAGADVAFAATIDATKKIITITPTSNLKFSQLYYVALAPVEDAFDNATTTLSSTFSTVAASTDATLSNLTYDGNQVSSFLPTTLDYSVQLPFGTTVVPTVVATKNYANATVNITPATDLAGDAAARTTTVLVTAEDGVTTKTYSIVFSITTAIADNTLSDLKIGGTTISGFAPSILSYSVVLPIGTTVVPIVSATKNDATASVVITQAVNVDGTLAERTASVVVTAQDASIKTYTVEFSVVASGADASLSDLKVDGNTVAGFAALTTTYNVSLAAGTTVVPTVTATSNDALANVAITPAVNLTGTVAERTTTIVVTAQNTTTITTYSVIFYVYSDDATLSNLTYNGNQVPSFAQATLNYNVTLPYGTTIVPTVVATKNFSNATVNVVPATDLAGNLAARTTTITVTAEDGIAIKTYAIVFTVALNNDATLSNLTSGGIQVPLFLPATLNYSIELPYGTTVVPVVVATKTDANATVNITPATDLAGDVAARTTTVLVTAADGITTKTYTVVYSIAPATAPLFTATYPKSANIGQDRVDVVVNTNAVGKAYFLKLVSGAAAPTSADVKSTGVAIDILAATTDYSATITGLTASTTYDVYFVTESVDGSALMATPVKLSITTSSAAISIHDIQYTTDASGNSPLAGTPVTFNGTVIEIKHNSTTGAQQGFYVQDAPGAWNGVYVYSSSAVVAVGDNVTISGTPKEYNGLTEIDPVTNVTVVSQGNTLPASVEITAQNACTEVYESVLVTVKNVTCVSGSAGSFVVNDGSGDLTAYKSLFPAFDLTIGSHYDLTGIMTWFSTASLYELYPRNANDVVPVTGVENNDAVATKAYPNPFTGDFKINAGKVVRNVTVSNMLGQKVMENTYSEENVTVVASGLKAGIYLVNVKFEDGTSSTLRMVKK